MKKDKLLFVARGGIQLGYGDTLSDYYINWPFVKIKLFEDKLVIEIYGGKKFNDPILNIKRYGMGGDGKKAIPHLIVLSYKDILRYKKTRLYLLEWLVGSNIKIIHKNKEYPEGIKLGVYPMSSKAICSLLDKKLHKN